ncbi:MAG: GMC oxidoreductase, partial [Gammaproteobacteria bacterium]
MQKISRRRLLKILGGSAVIAGSGGFWQFVHSYRQRTGTAYDGPRIALRDLPEAAAFDVCIIGSGPAGVTLGLELARQGLRTAILESGDEWNAMAGDPRFQQLDSYEVAGDTQYPLLSSRVRALGGTSNIWTGRCNRLHAIDFAPNAYTPAGGGWPIRYADIQRHYLEAEETLRVSWPGRYEYPPGHEMPFWRELSDPALRRLQGFQAFMEARGYDVDTSPTSSGILHRGPVRYAGDYLPDFAELRAGLLVTGATVTGLSRSSNGAVREAQVTDLEGRARSVTANVFVIAGGAVETARLLLLSGSRRDPGGLGNRFDQVGRYFHEHPNVRFKALVPAGSGMPVHAAGRSEQFYDAFKKDGFGSVLLVFRNHSRDDGSVILRISATVEMRPVATNRITLSETARDLFGNPGARLDFSFSPDDGRTMERTRALLQSIFQRLGAENVTELQTSWSHHHLGGVRMGSDPAHSVIDRHLRVHD